MKRLIKRPLRALWRLTSPVRRPVVRKIEALLARSYAQAAAAIPAPHVHVANHCRVTEEAGLLMDFMVRELVRLQTQVDRLREAVEERAPATAGAGLSVVGDDEPTRAAAG